MRVAIVLLVAGLASGARAAPMSLLCRQQISQTSYAGNGTAIPTQHLVADVRYRLDPAARTIEVTSKVAHTVFADGRDGNHVVADRDGMTVTSAATMPQGGPQSSQTLHFAADGSHASGSRDMRLHGRRLQHAETQMTCTRTN